MARTLRVVCMFRIAFSRLLLHDDLDGVAKIA